MVDGWFHPVRPYGPIRVCVSRLGAVSVALPLVFSPRSRELPRGVDQEIAEARRGGGAAGHPLDFRMPYGLGCWVHISLNEWVTSAFVDGE